MGSDLFDMLMIRLSVLNLPLSTLTASHERLLTVPQEATQGRKCPQRSHPDITATPAPNREPGPDSPPPPFTPSPTKPVRSVDIQVA